MADITDPYRPCFEDSWVSAPSQMSWISDLYMESSDYLCDIMERKLYESGIIVEVLDFKVSGIEKTGDPVFPERVVFEFTSLTYPNKTGPMSLEDMSEPWDATLKDFGDMYSLVQKRPSLTSTVRYYKRLKK